MSDVVCHCCSALKPEIGYPHRKGKRTGRVCLACLAHKVAHRVRPSTSSMKHAREAAKLWNCEACGKSYPDVYPNNWGLSMRVLDALCRGCAVRRRKTA